MADELRDSARRFLQRYRGVPAAVLLPQLFLAIGWLRAGVAHAIEGAWWAGDELLRFLASDTTYAIGMYEPFLDYVVQPLPVLTAVIVCALQLAVGVMLVLNVRPLVALAAGAFMNLHFILAGVVNPSAFYLVIALVVVLWRMERTVSLATSRKLAKATAIAAGVTTLFLLPYTSRPAPAEVIDDPALVLIFLSLLFAGATWWTHHRIAID